MEESFRVRVDKTFGSLTASSSAQLSSLWCLTADEIERNEEVSEPRTNSFLGKKKSMDSHAQLENDLAELYVDEDGHEDDYDEEWEIKASIGLDSTLDFEEEDDEYDKVAVGKENKEDRLYMKDVNNYETEADDWDALPTSFKDLARDPRANHIAAKIRLKEDAETAKKMNSLHVSVVSQDDQFMSPSIIRAALGVSENKAGFQVSEDNRSWSMSTQPKVSESDDNNSLSLSEARESLSAFAEKASVCTSEYGGLKKILKRKDVQIDPKLRKRVRFSSDYCRDERGEKDSEMQTFSADENKVEKEYLNQVPDYMRNPSKYTRYTFGSDEMDEESNRKAYMDFINMMKSEEHSSVELPRSVSFVPKRKPPAETELGQKKVGKDSVGKRGVMAVDAVEDDEVCPMKEADDTSETAVNVMMRSDKQRYSRQYRNKVKERP
ncbi:PREDICTED: uncharacterized protein LOC104821138 [Tarenaya hassleriana]|uniref:uncharacterized protein LOC104821138 n=1 Tax=Tarenaya hassleriana TaxID=28532 RepID=UPI00053C3643|nr:PREDICTED: uncharacterized protein LOC104821138 [Tarenaya hassleriana]